ncbi:MAG: mechanosensitive ion channel family protein [Halanaeroarchaeum sp.]
MNPPPWIVDFPKATGLTGRDVLLLATAVLGLTAFLLVRYVVEPFVNAVRRLVSWALVRGIVADWVEQVRTVTPWWAGEGLVVRFVNLTIGLLAAFGALVIWGRYSLIVEVLSRASLSVPVLVQVLITLLLFLGSWIAVDVLDSWLEEMTDRSDQFSKHQEEIVLRTLQIALFAAVSLGVLTLWGVNLGGLLVGAGFLGIILGMAARQTLGSLLAGFVLMFSRPFEIGDWVQVGQEEGIVTDITIVNTRLENFDGEFIVLPNDMVANSTIVNRSKKGRLRVRVQVDIDYDADPEHAQDVAVDALADVEKLLSVPRPQAITRSLGDSGVTLEIRFWIDKPSARRRARVTSAAIRAIKEAFDREGIKIPFPQRELSGRAETGGFRVVEDASGDEE